MHLTSKEIPGSLFNSKEFYEVFEPSPSASYWELVKETRNS